MTFTKGGLLSTTQLESISGKKWKKGGILNATQLNELSGGDGAYSESILKFELVEPVEVIEEEDPTTEDSESGGTK